MRKLLLFCLASAALAPAAGAIVLNFEGLPTTTNASSFGWYDPIPDNYGGFQWSESFYVFDASTAAVNPSGYTNGLVSGKNVAFNAGGDPVSFGVVSGTFTLNSLYVTAAWREDLNVSITGYLGPDVLHSISVTVSATKPTTRVVLNWDGIDKVVFASGGGRNSGYGVDGNNFALDDVRVNEPTGAPVPEPFTAALGLGGLALAARRRR